MNAIERVKAAAAAEARKLMPDLIARRELLARQLKCANDEIAELEKLCGGLAPTVGRPDGRRAGVKSLRVAALEVLQDGQARPAKDLLIEIRKKIPTANYSTMANTLRYYRGDTFEQNANLEWHLLNKPLAETQAAA